MRVGVLLLALGGFYAALACAVPLTDDEVYYWCWSRDLQSSYFDHPPLTAYLIRASTSILGDSALAIRLPACIASMIVLGIILHLTRPQTLVPLVALTPPFTFGAILITPDTPLLLFWAAYLAWLVGAHRRLDLGEGLSLGTWVLGGLLLGFGALGKYTTALAVPAAFLSFIISRHPPRCWAPGFLFHGAISLLCFAPVLAHNLEHDFAPLRFQWKHSMGQEVRGGLSSFGEFIGIQIVLVGLLPFLLFPWVLRHARVLAKEPESRVCLCMFAAPLGFFLYKAATSPLEGNWALVSYLSFWPLAAKWWEGGSVRSLRNWVIGFSFAFPLLCNGLLAVHLVHPFDGLPPRYDRVTRQSAKLDLAQRAADDLRVRGESLPVYVPTYQWTALLRYHGVDARQIDGISRPSYFTSRSEHPTDVDHAYMFSEGALPLEMMPGFEPPEIVGSYPLIVRGEQMSMYFLIRYRRARPTCVEEQREHRAQIP